MDKLVMNVFSSAVIDSFCLLQYFVAVLLFVLPMILKEYMQKSPAREDHKSTNVILFHTLTLKIGSKLSLKIVDEDRAEKSLLSSNLCSFLSHITSYKVNIESANHLSLNVNGHFTLNITHAKSDSHYQHLYTLEWKRNGLQFGRNILEDSFELLGSHWYGAGHVFQHFWPMEKWNIKFGPFVTGEGDPLPFATSYYGGIQERMWICSTGVGLYVDKDVPLFVSTNHDFDNKLKFRSQFSSPYSNPCRRDLFLSYHVCQSKDIKDLTLFMKKTFVQIPQDIPCEDIFRYPIWSSWAQFKTNIDQNKILEFAKAIKEYGFEASQIEIDDDWTPHYGDFQFEKSKFPNAKEMIDELKAMGYKVSIWIHPYMSPFSKQFIRFCSDGFLLKGWFGLPSIFKWWNGYAALVDFTNEEASRNYLKSLEKLKFEYGVDTFKIDAGEVWNFSSRTMSKKMLTSPNEYTTLFAEIGAKSDTKLKAQEMRTGYQNQSLPMFFRLQDKDSNWGYFNGLKTVIPHVLTFGLLGYPYILPDMIGGNGRPSKELYVRWVQLNTLMPAMQFSVVPWSLDPEVVVIVRRMLKIRKTYAGTIIDLAKNATKTGEPICRPLWWIDPTDEVALTIDSEFLLGNDILVTPVLENEARSRDIYLPSGKWKDEISQKVYEGGKWLRDYQTGFVDLPHFSKHYELEEKSHTNLIVDL